MENVLLLERQYTVWDVELVYNYYRYEPDCMIRIFRLLNNVFF